MPITIPVVNGASVDPKFIPKEGQDVKALPSAFGVSSADDMGRGFMSVSKSMEEHAENQATILATEATNKLNQFQLDILHNNENGYFTKQGKAALGQEQALSEAWDKQVNDIADAMPNKMAQAKFKAYGGKSKIGYLEDVYSHANAQAVTYQKDVMANGIEVNSQLAFANRNNPLVVDKYIGNIRGVIAANNPDKTPEAIKLVEDAALSKMHVANISGMLADHNLMAQGYYEQYKNQISPEVQGSIMKNIKENDADVKSRMTADSLFHSGVGEQDAFAQAHAIKDLDLRDATESKLSYLYGRQRELKKQTYSDNLDKFWNDYEKNPDINNIPAWMEGKDKIAARNYAVKDGKPETSDDVITHLTDMQLNNAGEFAKVDLNQYRADLTNAKYTELSKAQNNYKIHGYTAVTPNDDAVKAVIDSFGIKGFGVPGKQAVATQIQSMVNEEERRLGKIYTKDEAKAAEQRIGSWLGSTREGGSAAKVLEQNKLKAGFYKGLSNDIAYFEKQHKRQPDQKEFQSILYLRANKSIQDHNSNIYESIKNTAARPKETKAVTYFAHDYLPNLGKKLGTNISIAPDQIFNPKEKDYKSYHNVNGVSHAVDVGMSGRPNNTKFDIVSNIVKDFPEAKIGTSDPVILRKFEGNKNVIDQRAFDKKHGTDHANHIHVTMNVGGNAAVVAQNKPSVNRGEVISKLASKGFSQAEINEYIKSRGI